MRTAMVLAAGLGTRLRPLTDELPKPLVPIGDSPAIAHIAARLALAGVSRMVVNTHHRADAFDGADLGLPAILIHEPRILGTAGGVANARELLADDDVIVWNGDILAEVDLAGLLEARRSRGALAAWAVAPREMGKGTVGISTSGDVVRVREFRCGEEATSGDFLGISVLGRAALDRLPPEGCLIGDVLGPAVARGERVTAVPHLGEWDDIGSLPAYLRANLRWLERRGATFFAGENAQIELPLDRSIAGPGSRVSGEGELSRVVVWPNAHVRGPLADSVVMTGGRVVRVG